MKGCLDNIFAITMDEEVGMEMVNSLVYEPMPKDEALRFLEDALAETANIILGNSLKEITGLEEYLSISSPFTLHSVKGSINYHQAGIWSYDFSHKEGLVQVSIIKTNMV